MSYLEFYASLTGLVAVILSVRENIWSWVLGLVNITLAFLMFYQVQLYPDMLLQIFFFITNIIGFFHWKFPKKQKKNLYNELLVSSLSKKKLIFYLLICLVCSFLLGMLAKHLNGLFPQLFSKPSAFPYTDSFTTVMSIFATFLLIRKKIEAWWIWLLVDAVSASIYFAKDVKLYALLYVIFCVIAFFGALNWQKSYKKNALQ